MKVAGKYIDPSSFKINNASGDGVTTIFTLTSTPISNAELEVLINGITRDITDDYSLTSNQVTFTFAPAIGQKIVFRYLKK